MDYLAHTENAEGVSHKLLDPEREGVAPAREGIVIEDHSAVIVPPAESQSNSGSNEKRARLLLGLAAENWDAPS